MLCSCYRIATALFLLPDRHCSVPVTGSPLLCSCYRIATALSLLPDRHCSVPVTGSPLLCSCYRIASALFLLPDRHCFLLGTIKVAKKFVLLLEIIEWAVADLVRVHVQKPRQHIPQFHAGVLLPARRYI